MQSIKSEILAKEENLTSHPARLVPESRNNISYINVHTFLLFPIYFCRSKSLNLTKKCKSKWSSDSQKVLE